MKARSGFTSSFDLLRFAIERDLVSTACGSGRVMDALKTRPLPQAVLTTRLWRSGRIQLHTAIIATKS